MKALWKEFSTFAAIGVANTLIHWQLFYVLVTAAQLSQAASNLTAFCVAALFSFYVHALYTFEDGASVRCYLLYILFMGVLSFVVGHYADVWKLHGLLTVGSFSLLSLVFGGSFSKFVLSREQKGSNGLDSGGIE
jgi:putative flippase GtrA